jgi:hypothetical protein
MATSGRPKEISFTPAVAGVVRVRCKFRMDWTGPIGSNSAYGACFREQSGTTLYSDAEATPAARNVEQPFTLQHVFDVTAGSLVKVGLFGSIVGLASVNFYDVKVEATFFPT